MQPLNKIEKLVEWLLKHDNEIVCLHPEKKIATEIVTLLEEEESNGSK